MGERVNESQDGLLVTLVKAAAAAAPVVLLFYLEDPSFRYSVDQLLAALRYRVRMAEWRARWWDRWAPHERERWEQRHGRLEG